MLNAETASPAPVTAGTPKLLRAVTLSIAAAATLGLLAVSTGQATAEPGTDCLWAGAPHAQGTTVVAGGRVFTCTIGGRGTPQWVLGVAANTPSTVANPGAVTRPAGAFSLGAQQPGTEYNDYCVGTQLVGGSEAVYEVVADATGALRWKAAGPISQWAFDPGTGPVPTTRSASLCPPDQVLWPELHTAPA
ncbi:hypothetical protein [Nocardia sp. NPDC049149]|uniref:hypothetical protein n=1 Tax=Nocardia sp. NPDC049149 TaxID=3364315 RepID=UPI0037190DC9